MLPANGAAESAVVLAILSRFHQGSHISHAREDRYLKWREKHGWLIDGLEAVTDPSCTPEQLEAAIQTSFRAIDTDGSGEIDKEELFQAMKKAADVELDVQDMEQLFSDMDLDGSGTINAEEFAALIKVIAATSKGS